jgi:OmpA-OmpF porin, OOP family
VKKYLFVLFLAVYSQLGYSQKIITLNPTVDEQSQAYVNITKVELTDEHTIIHFRYTDKYATMSRQERELMQRLGMSSQTQIEIDPNTRLYEPKNTKKKFKFIKALGIPTAPEVMHPKMGEIVNFRVYYERLDAGIEVFDIFEGRDREGKQYWNFYGVHIKNPKKKVEKPQPKPAPQKLEEKPKVEEKIAVPTVAPATVAAVKGNVLDAKTKKPIAAKLSYVLPNEEGGNDSLLLSASSGKFKLNLAPGHSYHYAASAKGYFPSNGAFDLSKATAGQEITTDILLNPMAIGEAMTLNNIYFEVTKFDLLPASYGELDQLVKLMQDNPNIEISVEGHTDNVGDFDENVALSLNRANAVKKYLVSKGIDSARIQTKGYGPTRPVSKGAATTDRQKNRRVEFVILKN